MKLDEQNLEPTKTTPLWRNQWICKALEELEELKPLCIETCMSSQSVTRSARRISMPLQHALCMLDDENVEPECQNK